MRWSEGSSFLPWIARRSSTNSRWRTCGVSRDRLKKTSLTGSTWQGASGDGTSQGAPEMRRWRSVSSGQSRNSAYEAGVMGLAILFSLAATLGLAACGKKDRPRSPRKGIAFQDRGTVGDLGERLGRAEGPAGEAIGKEGRDQRNGDHRMAGIPRPLSRLRMVLAKAAPWISAVSTRWTVKVGEDGRFSARVVLEPPVEGIHFFQVRLTGRRLGRGFLVGSGQAGDPLSDLPPFGHEL